MTVALITNDDGVASPGIRALAEAALDLGIDIVVAAPSWDSSGASASLTGVSDEGKLCVEEWTIDGLPGVAAYAVEAAPALIARTGVHGGFGPVPDLVLSGVNLGQNTGQAVLHSGTVGAALTARTHGRRAVAVSLAGRTHVETGARFARGVIQWVLDAPGPLVANLNVPDRPADRVLGLRRAHLAEFGGVQTQVTERGKGYVAVSYAEADPSADPGSDAALVAEGWATVTPLSPVCEAVSVATGALTGEPRAGAHRDGGG